MNRRLEILAYVLMAAAAPSHAFEIPGDSTIALGGRFETFVQTDRSSSPFPWDYTSRSPVDFTRLMLDLRAGRETWGTLYLKGAGTWRFSDDAAGRVPFSFEQGDYLWRRTAPRHRLRARVWAMERRYFTGEMGSRLLDDDIISLYDTHYGARFDGDAGRFRWNALVAGLDNAAGSTRGIGYASAGWFSRHVQASAVYLHDAPAVDSLDTGEIFKGEVSAYYRRSSLTVSYEQYGVEGDFSGSFDWDGGSYSSIMPGNAATFAEVRLQRLPVGQWGRASLWGRYRAVGEGYANNLSADMPASVTSTAGVYLYHRRYAVDGRLFYRSQVRYRFVDTHVEKLEAHAHAYFQQGFEAFLRGALGKSYGDGAPTRREHFLYGAIRRTLRKFLGGFHGWVGYDDLGQVVLRTGAELRVNLSARSSFYTRMITTQSATSSDALYLRLEYRPLYHVFATISYGRRYIGDGPYLLEDSDIGRTGPTDNVYTFTVRGDF